MKHLFALLLSSTIIVTANAQAPGKTTLTLQRQAKTYAEQGKKLRLLVQGDAAAIDKAAKTHGGRLVYSHGNIASVELPAQELNAFVAEKAISRVEGGPRHLQPLNDTMKIVNNITPVRNGQSPLPQGYDGSGVILGFIDSGIDFTHPDFLDSANKTRVLYIWDQRATTGPPGPAPYNYGVEWTKTKIDSGLCTHDDLAFWGHGTGVVGIGAGDGSSTNTRDFSGAAPKADIIMVALDFNGQNSPTAVADAADYIFAKAAALGRPCVINASVGDYYGSHDGQDLQAQMIDNLLTAQSGRSLVGAVGNAGNEKIHLSYTLSSDTNFSWFVPNPNYAIYIQLWADTNNFNAAKMAIGMTQTSPVYSDRGRSNFTTIAQNLSGMNTDTIRNSSGQQLALVQRQSSIQGSAYSMEFLVFPDSLTDYNISLETTGGGLFHLWSFDTYTGSLPSASAYPRITYIKEPDTISTVVSGFQCSDKVITVGNFVTRRFYPNYNNTYTEDTTVTAGAIMWNSSVGPTRDGRIRPDITATGANIMTCGVLSMLPAIIASAPQVVAPGGFHVCFGGSSASSPAVAGIVALYLQRYPNATWSDIKNAITMCSRTDAFTGTNLPDNTWGHGKVDAFNAIVGCPMTSHSEQLPVNTFSVYPNPADESMTFAFSNAMIPAGASAEIRLANLVGQTLRSTAVNTSQQEITLQRGSLASGVYLCSLVVEGRTVAVQKIVLR